MSHRSKALAACACLLVSALLVTPGAATAGDPILSIAWLTIGGVVSHPPNPCMPDGVGEAVALSGMAHVATKVDVAADSIMIHINLADVMGTGATTGMTYLAVGAFGTEVSPGLPEIPISAAFNLCRPGPAPPSRAAPPSSAPCPSIATGR
ncbi:MAG: hypothetical protein KGJ27_11775 [candidate division NC10 bacterium]|nr:hypothetical protein [candidate division NC10 bacterium]